ncbi:hypothetical protein ACNFH5_17615 [Pseudomonas sp. NY15435]|uniref:hypothetical protein n=1 Tax=Pseudomonas sp. NY15435 TaxID=3400358 RepID=UPI003A8A10D7
MSNAAKWLAVFVLFILCLAVAGLLISLKLGESARNESRWIIDEMWDADYFNRSRGNVAKDEALNIMSLKKGASRKEGLLEYVRAQNCSSLEARCILNDLSIANLLVDSGELDSALNMLSSVPDRLDKIGGCPIGLESSLLRYHEGSLERMPPAKARRVASSLVVKIRTQGGLLRNLRSEQCDKLAQSKPELFHEYVTLTSRVMELGDAGLFKQGAYITSVNKMDFE